MNYLLRAPQTQPLRRRFDVEINSQATAFLVAHAMMAR
jgi:hypothetical protein